MGTQMSRVCVVSAELLSEERRIARCQEQYDAFRGEICSLICDARYERFAWQTVCDLQCGDRWIGGRELADEIVSVGEEDPSIHVKVRSWPAGSDDYEISGFDRHGRAWRIKVIE